MTERKLRVAVVFGGHGAERTGSCLSAGSVLSQLDTARFDMVPVGLAADGSWVLAPEGPRALEAGANTSEIAVPDQVGEVLGEIDVVFPVFHGTYGEDGTIQGLLELAGVPYAGAGVLASAAAMDGEFSRKLLAAEGVPIAPFVVLRRGAATVDDEAMQRLGLPVEVTPARRSGSGTTVTTWPDLPAAIEMARTTDHKVIITTAPTAKEIQCGVLEYPNGQVDASLPAEPHDDGADIPAKLPDDVIQHVRDLAIKAFKALNCQGLAQVDFRVTENDTVTVHQVNTMPGFDHTSLYPKMWAVTGIDTPTLLTTLVETAVARGTGLR
jgi:D-alanine-D-alanine ligase